MYQDFIKYGRFLFQMGLNHLHSGNMSVRKADAIYITAHGAKLGDLSFNDIVSVNLYDDKKDKNASSEIPVHRAIYMANQNISTIIHAHPPFTTVISFFDDEIKPIDSDSLYIPEVPVVKECPYEEGSPCVAQHFLELFLNNKLAVVRGHGTFSVGKDLEEACLWISMLENSCRILYYYRILNLRS